ncbi:trihelix transcription factor GTL1 isoform X1 [Quercus robur]|uniref:trihelix transcription factor GTL1 isoform X1 n=1 Tax=Quercus robur TaxID=38942 RepID=UPI0021617292|nr:trihelix transcription factor GTL1 isoform X1 [Quercus robur]
MEGFTGDGEIPSPEEPFHGHVAPFPDTAELIYANPPPAINFSPVELIPQRHSLPPQKLRPIRRSPPESSELPEQTLAGTLATFSAEEEDAGFLAAGKEVCAVNRVVGDGDDECFETPKRVGSGTCCWGPNDEVRVLDELEAEFSTSSDEDDDDDYTSANINEPINRKRKRKPSKKLKGFLESLVGKVMERQERMHKELMEVIEKREQERRTREEAWRQQEMERMKREEEVRTQEMSRSLALISLIQNILGDEIQVPQPLITRCKEEDGGEIGMLNEVKCDPNNKKWLEAEVQALIALRTTLEHKFRPTGSRGSIWEEISVELYNMGYNRSAKKCKEKWDNMNKYFRRSMESGKKHAANGKACQYFHDLNILYGNGIINPGNNVTENEAKSEK